MYYQDFAERVERSALLLDEYCPGWAATINTDRLDVGSTSLCPVSQTFRERYLPFAEGLNLLGLGYPYHAGIVPEDYAFWDEGIHNNKINKLWRQQITTRLQQAASKP